MWECRQFLSTQNELYETCRATGDFPITNRLRMVSFSRVDKKKCKRIIILGLPLTTNFISINLSTNFSINRLI